MADLSTVRNRDRLQPQREPYWHKLATGQFLGFRPSKIGKGGTWIARYYDPDTGRKPLRALGDFGHLTDSERFSAASQQARDWFRHLSHGGSEEDLTVKQACEKYAASNADAAKRFPRYVYDDPIASIKLQKLREHHVREWRRRLEKLPAVVSRTKDDKTTTRQRSAATINRDMVALRAALNAAFRRGEVTTTLAWQQAMKPAEARGRRHLYLDKSQRRALLDALGEDPVAAAFCRGLCLLPIRPGALAALRVGDLDQRAKTLLIEHDKANADRRILLPDATAELLGSMAGKRKANAPLFDRGSGRAWDKDAWKGPIKKAAKTANLSPETTAYTLRHSTITDLVTEGLDLLTVAQISGTSVRMIERHYGHLRNDRAAAALAGLAL
ncbi:integrase [Lysobacter oculi]|uniref:Integrase n=1 Tax=Solilutibacter oculi TaxID=2698682 RepID=A0A344J5Y6_9GAMM|nr:tyrosine-type recombinase/integrase [Lysobacter oculi]AXA84446.1 integrase [Lysobacter oculi]